MKTDPSPRPAVFLDRDGTINEQMGYINHPSRFVLLPGVGRAIKMLNENKYHVVVVTNQSGVARGYFPEALVLEIHKLMKDKLMEEGARVDGIYYCPHYPDAPMRQYSRACECRKPKPGLIQRALAELSIDMRGSWVIGDTCTDLEMAERVGLPGILVQTGYGLGEQRYVLPRKALRPAYIASDLLDAVSHILGK